MEPEPEEQKIMIPQPQKNLDKVPLRKIKPGHNLRFAAGVKSPKPLLSLSMEQESIINMNN